MEMRGLYAVVVFLVVVESELDHVVEDLPLVLKDCPTWFLWNGSDCECGGRIGRVIQCNQRTNNTVMWLDYCMTVDSDSTFVGPCPFSTSLPRLSIIHSEVYSHYYFSLPRNVSQLNNFMCGGLNRTGKLCGHCEPGLGPAVLSYQVSCVKCMKYGWLLYISLACIPTTILFVLVIIFQIHATSAPLNFFVSVCQYFTYTIALIPQTWLSSNTLAHILVTLYGIWNLDFFRFIIPAFCISDSFTTLQVLSMDYLVAFYPLILIALTYICIELHARDFKLIVQMWRPFSACFLRFRRRWDPRGSTVQAFATFLLLSYSKLLFNSFSLLGFTNLHNITGEQVGSKMVYYNASVPYFSSEHRPFGILAIFVLTIFVALLPIFLCMYPCQTFQRCLGFCRIRWHAIHVFAEAFNGCYKDGTKGTRDYRYFGGFYLFIRIAVVFTWVVTKEYSMIITMFIAQASLLLFALLRPYKDNWFNAFDTLAWALMATSMMENSYSVSTAHIPEILTLLYLFVSLPALYFSLYIVFKVLLQLNVQWCHSHQRLQKLMERFTAYQHDHEETQIPNGLPDRLLHPPEYEELEESAQRHWEDSVQDELASDRSSVPTYGAV